MAVFPGVTSHFPVWEMQYSLNILAYDSFEGVEAQRAANDWAGTTGLELLAALNYKNGTHSVGSGWQELNAVCNSLAGTSGLEAQFALSNLAQTEMAMALSQVATTGPSGFALQNATPNILSWTAPNDAKLHSVALFAELVVATNQVGGSITAVLFQVGGIGPFGGVTLFAGGLTNSPYMQGQTGAVADNFLLQPGEEIVIKQNSAQTGGAATLFASLLAN